MLRLSRANVISTPAHGITAVLVPVAAAARSKVWPLRVLPPPPHVGGGISITDVMWAAADPCVNDRGIPSRLVRVVATATGGAAAGDSAAPGAPAQQVFFAGARPTASDSVARHMDEGIEAFVRYAQLVVETLAAAKQGTPPPFAVLLARRPRYFEVACYAHFVAAGDAARIERWCTAEQRLMTWAVASASSAECAALLAAASASAAEGGGMWSVGATGRRLDQLFALELGHVAWSVQGARNWEDDKALAAAVIPALHVRALRRIAAAAASSGTRSGGAGGEIADIGHYLQHCMSCTPERFLKTLHLVLPSLRCVVGGSADYLFHKERPTAVLAADSAAAATRYARPSPLLDLEDIVAHAPPCLQHLWTPPASAPSGGAVLTEHGRQVTARVLALMAPAEVDERTVVNHVLPGLREDRRANVVDKMRRDRDYLAKRPLSDGRYFGCDFIADNVPGACPYARSDAPRSCAATCTGSARGGAVYHPTDYMKR